MPHWVAVGQSPALAEPHLHMGMCGVAPPLTGLM